MFSSSPGQALIYHRFQSHYLLIMVPATALVTCMLYCLRYPVSSQCWQVRISMADSPCFLSGLTVLFCLFSIYSDLLFSSSGVWGPPQVLIRLLIRPSQSIYHESIETVEFLSKPVKPPLKFFFFKSRFVGATAFSPHVFEENVCPCFPYFSQSTDH